MRDDFFRAAPRKFKEVILGAFREEGRRWLESLPEIIAEIEREWSIEIKKPFPNLSYHFVAPCVLPESGGEAVVKIAFPGEANGFFREAKTLEFCGGDGAVKLLKRDEKRFAMLLEKLSPGENLKIVCRGDDKKAVEIAIETMRRFWREPPADYDFPTLEMWFDGLNQAEKLKFAPEYVRKARRFFDELNSAPQALLHGDFHHENILSARREPFLAIDPKGIVGPRGYDSANFLLNHANWLQAEPNFREKLDAAFRRFSEALEIETADLRKWAFAHSVLSAFWTFEENCENWKREIERTEIWRT
jgi:streptomycin 6-kinase